MKKRPKAPLLYARRKERIKERHNVHVEVDMKDFLSLKSILILERVSFSEWLGLQIKAAIADKQANLKGGLNVQVDELRDFIASGELKVKGAVDLS